MKDLEARLVAARAAFEAVSRAHPRTDWTAYDAAQAELLEAERALAAARGEEHAVPLEFPVLWNVGAPMPQLMVNDHVALLIFRVKVVDPHWDGTYASMVDGTKTEAYALVRFKRCRAAKLGAPNDEVFSGHPLSGRGMQPYRAQIVKSSRWIVELEQINRVHPGYRPQHWSACNHYVFWFHDSTFECIADGFDVEVREATLPEMRLEACRRMNLGAVK